MSILLVSVSYEISEAEDEYNALQSEIETLREQTSGIKELEYSIAAVNSAGLAQQKNVVQSRKLWSNNLEQLYLLVVELL